VKSNPKTAQLYESVRPPKKAIAKKDVKPKVVAKNVCDGRLIAKFNNNNSGEFGAES